MPAVAPRPYSRFLPARARSTDQPRSRTLRARYLVAGALLGAATAGPVCALALDAVVEQSSLGQPLRIVVPVVLQPGEALSGDCVKVVPARADAADDIPDVSMARVVLEQSAGESRLVVTTGRAVGEPAMRVTLQAGCDRAIRREYLLLFDPPPIESPAVAGIAPLASDSPTTGPATIATRTGVAPTNPVAGATAVSASSAATRATNPAAGGTPGRSTGERRRSTSDQASGPRRTTTAPPARADRPRLAISRTVGATDAAGKDSGEKFSALATSTQDAALEEQEVVLRNRIADLSAQVERMQQERIAELTAAVERLQFQLHAAEAAQRAAEVKASNAPRAVLSQWWDDSWPFVVSLGAIGALVVGGLAWWRRRPVAPVVGDGETPLMANVSAATHVDTYLDEALIAGPQTFPRRVVPGEAFTPSSNEHEDDFDREMSAKRPQPRGKSRR